MQLKTEAEIKGGGTQHKPHTHLVALEPLQLYSSSLQLSVRRTVTTSNAHY